LDTETWYANRLRVEVSGGSGSVRLQSSLDDTLSEAEFSEGLALLHRDPFPGEKLSTVIRVRQKQPFNLKVRYPDPQDSRVAEFKFGSITAAGSVRLTMSASGVSLLTNPGDVEGIAPDSNLTTTEIWDVSDVVWIGGILPVNQILIGLMLSLLMGWLPALVMSFLLYWSDRYEKEPLPLLAVTFLWGALPALIAAFLLRLFVSTSIDLTSSAAFGTGLLGWVEAITEESLKAIIVLWVAHRYRREFDNVLDGVIYGGMVGIGFAMNANIISYLGSFLSRGFDGLNAHILINGILFCINHALFTAIFGAGLGYARLFPSNRRNWVIPSSAFLISIAARTTHDWINLRGIGFNFGNFIFTTLSMVGLVLVVIQSLRRQRLCLEVELLDQVPAEVYQTLLHPVRRFQAQVSTFRQGGVRAWRNQRRLFQLCAEYAFKRQQVRMHPGESVTAAEAERLKEEIGRLLEKE
jgi:RsiW-degrading membrane proteinase PrsW (M82 family)